MLTRESIDTLFGRLHVRYGSSWKTRWEGADLDAVKMDWCRVLGSLNREQVLYGLDHLPEFVPTSHQFREACLRMPDDITKQYSLPPPAIEPEKLAGHIAKLRALRGQM